MTVSKMSQSTEADLRFAVPVQVASSVLVHPELSLAARGLYAVVSATRDNPAAQAVLDATPRALRSELLSELAAAGYAWRNESGDVCVGDPTLQGDEPWSEQPELSRSGWAYAIAGDNRSLVKIGTSGDVAKRLRGLQTSSPQQLEVLWRSEGGRALEAHLHECFAELRVRGEWFNFAGLNAVELIERAARSFA